MMTDTPQAELNLSGSGAIGLPGARSFSLGSIRPETRLHFTRLRTKLIQRRIEYFAKDLVRIFHPSSGFEFESKLINCKLLLILHGCAYPQFESERLGR